jgi:hypothetical protein
MDDERCTDDEEGAERHCRKGEEQQDEDNKNEGRSDRQLLRRRTVCGSL